MKDSWLKYVEWQKRPQKDAHVHMSPPSDYEGEIYDPWNRTASEKLLDTTSEEEEKNEDIKKPEDKEKNEEIEKDEDEEEVEKKQRHGKKRKRGLVADGKSREDILRSRYIDKEKKIVSLQKLLDKATDENANLNLKLWDKENVISKIFKKLKDYRINHPEDDEDNEDPVNLRIRKWNSDSLCYLHERSKIYHLHTIRQKYSI